MNTEFKKIDKGQAYTEDYSSFSNDWVLKVRLYRNGQKYGALRYLDNLDHVSQVAQVIANEQGTIIQWVVIPGLRNDDYNPYSNGWNVTIPNHTRYTLTANEAKDVARNLEDHVGDVSFTPFPDQIDN